jgi:hypothetical protein
MNDTDIKKKLKDFEKRLQFHDAEIDNLKEALKGAKEQQETTITELRAFMRDVNSPQEKLPI